MNPSDKPVAITIGRQGPDSNVFFQTPPTDTTISRQHARISRDNEGNLFIEDLNSSCGTFVNGFQIAKCPISANDNITLGHNGYRLSLSNILKRFPPLPISDHAFSAEMNKLKYIYFAHQEAIRDLQSKQQKIQSKRMYPTMRASLMGTIAIATLTLSGGSQGGNLNAVIPVIVGLMGIVAYFVAEKIITSKTEQCRIDIEQENSNFLIAYKCPHCKRTLGNQSWDLIASYGECPMCRRKFTPK